MYIDNSKYCSFSVLRIYNTLYKSVMTKENNTIIIFFKGSLWVLNPFHLHFKAYHLKRWMCEKMVKCMHVIKFILPLLEMESDLK